MKALQSHPYKEARMRRSRHTPRQLFGLTLTLVGLLSWHILPIPHPELAVRAANRAVAGLIPCAADR